MNKKADLVHQVIIHLILIGLIFGLFYLVLSMRVNNRNVKQQVLEKQLALMIDSSIPGTTLVLSKDNMNGYISAINIKQNKIFVYIDGLTYSRGYNFFTKYSVEKDEDENKFYIYIK
ncbi:MAG: hypothetical protein ACOYT4_04365 [Nanoarchaeota archaeon]